MDSQLIKLAAASAMLHAHPTQAIAPDTVPGVDNATAAVMTSSATP